jgi:hypothetical protein
MGVVDVPNATKIRYVAQATPPPDDLDEFVEKLIAPPITLPVLRIADQMPVTCQHNHDFDGDSYVPTEVEPLVFRSWVRQHSRGFTHVQETSCNAFDDLRRSV